MLQDEGLFIPGIVKFIACVVERRQGVGIQLLPGVGDGDAQIPDNFFPVKQHLEIHGLRDGIDAAPILVGY